MFYGRGLISTKRLRLASGFTLIELLVVISIIGLLVAILLPVLGSAKDSACQAARLSGARQMMIGYTSQYTENKGEVLYGKLPFAGLYNEPLYVMAAGDRLYDPFIAQRYPWRLAEHVDGFWDIMYSHTETPDVPQPGQTPAEIYSKAYTLSLSPGFGINSVYVGGDLGADGFTLTSDGYVPNRGKHVVFQDVEVNRPSELIVFADAKETVLGVGGEIEYINTPTGEQAGFIQATPRRLNGLPYWKASGSEIEPTLPTRIVGLPEGHCVDATTTAFFDGSARSLSYDEISDMRLWANNADSENYDYSTQ
ncbi:MAG: type II secretion system protein [Planctomycetota bacterium]